MSPESPAEPIPQAAEEPRMWERLGICIAFQPLLWGLRVDREWRSVAVEIGPLRLTVQWP
jgi:hypothetical protein